MMIGFDFWQILGIEITNDIKVIKQAYASKTKIYHPEEQPEQFKELQDAYHLAIAFAKSHKNQDIKNYKEYQTQKDDLSGHNDFQISQDMGVKITIGKNNQTNSNIRKMDNIDSEKQIRQYQLDKVKVLLKEVNVVSIDKIFMDENITKYLGEEDFKKKFEDIILLFMSKHSVYQLQYLELIAKNFNLDRVCTTIEKRKNPKSSTKLLNGGSIFLILIFLFYIISGVSTSNQTKRKDDIKLSPNPTKSIEEMTNDTAYNIHQSYLNKVRVSYNNKKYYLMNENGEYLSDGTGFDGVMYTYSHLLVMKLEDDRMIFNTRTKQMLEDKYTQVKLCNLYEDNEASSISNKVIIVQSIDTNYYVIATDGKHGAQVIVEDENSNHLYLENNNYYLR